MRAHPVMRAARHCVRNFNIWRRWSALLLLGLALLILQGCASPAPVPLADADPSNAAAPAPTASYRPVGGDYQSRRPVEPAPWRERNESVSPAPKPRGAP